jgi:hypothetical protein
MSLPSWSLDQALQIYGGDLANRRIIGKNQVLICF